MPENLKISAIKVQQWVETWDKVKFSNSRDKYRTKPSPYFFLFTLNAIQLKKLSNVYIRKRETKNVDHTGIQRSHESERSEEIKRFLINGYPLSESKGKIDNVKENPDLLMPGWLPTAIIANILPPHAERNGNKLAKGDQIEVIEESGNSFLVLPKKLNDPSWEPLVHPLEIIDGQHRLWAFDEKNPAFVDYELPVVAFYNLDRSWQAYLFFTINIKPKKINRSLAYDLIPMLRVEEWLEKSFDKANVYRETRAQEIVESLWAIPGSPWYNRINMLGERKNSANITQAAFIRNLIATFFKSGSSGKLGGLFGSRLRDTGLPLEWNRTQQIAFMIYIWERIFNSSITKNIPWIKSLLSYKENLFSESTNSEIMFFSEFSLISTDQGVRGVLHIINDFVFTASTDFNVRDLFKRAKVEEPREKIDYQEVQTLKALLDKNEEFSRFITNICETILQFDWRTSSFDGLDPKTRLNQMIFKGSSGYKELRMQLLDLCKNSDNDNISNLAKQILRELGYGKNKT